VKPTPSREMSSREADGFVMALELVLTTAIIAGLGFLLDRALGTIPVFTVAFGVFTAVYEVWKLVVGYNAQMAAHTDRRDPLRHGPSR
jgi:F0F1-type ATP synthase assembly protein I